MLGMKCAPCFAVGKWGQIPTNASDDFLHQLGQLSLQGGPVCFVPSHQHKGCCGALSLMVMRHILTPNLDPFVLMTALFIS